MVQGISRASLSLFICLAFLAPLSEAPLRTEAIHPVQAGAASLVEGPPLVFEANVGQTDGAARFVARGRQYHIFLTSNDAIVAVPGERGASVRMSLEGANAQPRITPLERQAASINHLRGSDPAGWRTNVPSFGRVRYEQVYPGIDLEYYGNEGRLEYDFLVARGADPSRIRIVMNGADDVAVEQSGDLTVRLGGGSMRLHKPVAYQVIRGTRRAVEARYVLAGTRAVRFALGPYDPDQPLVIDPILSDSTAAAENVSLTINLTGPNNGTVGVIPSGLLCSKPGSTSCTVSFAAGTSVRIVANGSAGSVSPPGVFSAGTGSAAACATSTCAFTIQSDSTVTATFDNSLGPFYRVTVTPAGDGQGEVGVDNHRRQNYDPPTASSAGTDYAANSVVSMGATPAPESRFSGYSNGTNGAVACGTAASCTFTITGNATVTATFHALTALAVEPGTASRTVGSSQIYTANGTFSNAVTETVSSIGPGVWRTKAPLGSTRHALAAAVAGGRIYAIGGINAGNGPTLATVEAYDPSANTWTSRPAMATARSGHAAAAAGDLIYVIGGNSATSSPIESVERYDPVANVWSPRAPLPAARRFLAAVALDGIVYAIGGETSSGVVATVEAYNPGTDTWSPRAPLKSARTLLSAVVAGNLIYVAGGADASGNPVSTVEVYDPASDTWTTKASLASARSALGAASADGVIYAIGGLDPGASSATTAYDPTANQWGNKAGVITSRAELAVVSFGGIVYAIGGRSTAGGGLNKVEAFTDAVRWSVGDASVAAITQAQASAQGIAVGQTSIVASIGALTCVAANGCGTLNVTPNTSTVAIDRTSITLGATVDAGTVVSSNGPATINLGVTGTALVTWTATPSQPWLRVSPASGTGSAAISVSIVSNAALPQSGTATAAITFQVSGASNSVGPVDVSLTVTPYVSSVAIDRTSLHFGATVDAGTVVSSTAPATIRLGVTGPALITWTATPSQPWLTVSPASGSGSAVINVSIATNAALPASGTTAATIAFHVTKASNTVGPVNVSLAITPKTAPPSPPFGSFDTPAGDATVLAGSIAVTGWALDNIGINRVEIWRDLQAGEPTTPFSSGPADPRNGKVFVSNAVFVEGARPDVETLNPNTPANYRAGWGYLLLTQGLFGQGNGTYKLYAFAFDQEDNVATLGSKTIVVDNNASAKPFGSIDTPAIGGDPGTTPNFGWALTPRVNGAATCRIPANGVQVSIDSGPLQPVAYGDARVDIAGAFPGFTNSAAAGGHFIFDWSTLRNGPHTIGWLVTDDCNRSEGVGSRFFNVTNGANALVPAPSDFPLKAETGRDDHFSLKAEATDASPAVALRPSAADEQDLLVLTRGYGGSAELISAGENDSPTIEIKQGERIELRAPRGYESAHQIVAGRTRGLPIGSTWDAASSIFYWEPAPGFLGRYRIVFSNGRGRINVRIVVVAGDRIR